VYTSTPGSTAVHCSPAVCPANNQQYLSINRDLLPTDNVHASSEDTNFNPAEDFVASSSLGDIPWCSDPDSVLTVQEQYVEINFTAPVVITLLESSGYFNAYVNMFTIEYGTLEGPLQLYTVNGQPRVSNVVLIV